MDKPLDPAVDWLADVQLTPDQRHIWNRMRSELIDTRNKLVDMDKRIKLMSREATDEQNNSVLTRPEFNREVARMLAFDERYGGISSVLYYDFDNMEDVTARYGKSVTNAALHEISTILMREVRGSDVVGRLAADEFGVLLVRCDNAFAWKKGKQISEVLHERLVEIHGCKLDLDIRYGAYTFSANEEVSKGLKEAAQMVTKVDVAR